MRNILCYFILSFLAINTFAQGSNSCSSGTLLVPTAGSSVSNNFTFTTALTPSSGMPNPTNFYYTVTSDNEIFPDATICKDIWYRVQVPASGGVVLDLFHTGSTGTDDLAMAVYDGCTGNLVAAADDYYTTSLFFEPSVAISCRTPGSILYVRIWRYGCSSSGLPTNFQILATDQADLTAGDTPGNAVVLPNTTGTTTTSTAIDNTLYPLMSPTIPTSLCSNAGYVIAGGCEDKWYKITLPNTKILDVSIAGASTNMTMQVFKGTPCSLTEVDCGSGIINPKLVDIAFSTSTDLFIRIFDQNCDEYDNFNLVTTIRNKNSNDLPCTATVLTVGAAAITDTLINNTPSLIIPTGSCAGNGSYCRDLWFRVTATSTGNMKIYTNVTGNIGVAPNSIYVSAYTATSCSGPFSLVGCKSPILNDSLQYFQNIGNVSYIRVQDYNCDTNAHQIYTIRAVQGLVPPNDEMCNATPLNAIDTIVGSVSNGTQSTQLPLPTCNFTTSNVCKDIWYTYTFTEDGTFDLKTICLIDCASNTTNIAVYTDGNSNPCDGSLLTQISCNTSAGATTSIPCLEGFTGDKYYFRIYDYDCNNNNRAITIYSNFTPAGNSLPCNAISLDFGLLVDTVETCGVVSSPASTPDPTSCGFISNANCETVWFKATVPTNGNLTVTVNPDYIVASSNDISIQAYTDTDNNPCNGGLVLLGTCGNGNNVFTKSYTGLTSGNQIYFRLWDFNCNGLKDFSIQVTSNNDVLLTNAVNGTTVSVACGNDINFYDDGGVAGNYTNHAPRSVTFEAPIGYRLRVEEQTLDITPAKTTITCVNSNTGSNDNLTVYDGTISGNKIAEFTGNLTTTGRFGSFIANSGKITFTFDADNSNIKAGGFHFIIKCEAPTYIQKQTVGLGSTISYTDPGGLLGNYLDNSFEIKTFCPSAGAIAASEKIQAILNGFQMESIADKIYIFDGDSTNAPLIGTFSGAQTLSNINKLGTIRASSTNTNGCLTFLFVSDATVNAAGYNATITTGKSIGANGGESCATALDISAGGKFQANTFLSTGDPRNTDPNLCITSCIAGAGTQPITQLEGTIWYKFTTPNITCTGVNLFTLDFTNVSTLLKGDANASYPNGTSGAQIALYQTNTCIANPANWAAAKLVCYDILQNGGDVNVSGLAANTTYYLMLDNFGGRPTNLDIIAKINVVDNNGDNICDLLPIELISFDAIIQNKNVFLTWKTATELNNDFYIIERSTDALIFTTISPKIKGAGTTTIPQIYNYIDVNPFDNFNNQYYYRLKQIDFDGKFTFSDLKFVKYENTISTLQVFPNPTTGVIHIINNISYSSDGKIEILDISGNVLLQKNVAFNVGLNNLFLDISSLSNGIYYLKITDKNIQQVKTINKIN